MPIYEFECRSCGYSEETINVEFVTCPTCGRQMKRVISAASIVIAGNPGPKLRTRVALDDELRRQGAKTPLFRSEEAKDKARWHLKKLSIR